MVKSLLRTQLTKPMADLLTILKAKGADTNNLSPADLDLCTKEERGKALSSLTYVLGKHFPEAFWEKVFSGKDPAFADRPAAEACVISGW